MSAPFARYLARRLLFALALVFVVSSGSLVLARLVPGDYAREVAGIAADPERVERLRAQYGLDQPILTQYASWLARAARLDFGNSYLYGGPVARIVADRAANTAILALAALLIATGLGIPLGVISGARPRSTPGIVIRACSVLLLSMPPLLTSLLLFLIAVRTNIVPVGGMGSLDVESGVARTLDLLAHLPVPALALGLPLAAMLERLQSQAMRDAMEEPCIRATMARGVSPARLVWRDALRLAGRPVASIYGLVVATLFSGSFIVELVTSWPGLGQLMFRALQARDVYLVAGIAAAGSVFLALGSVVSDVAVAAIDPRVRLEADRA